MNKNWYIYFYELVPNNFIFAAKDYVKCEKGIYWLADNVPIKLLNKELFDADFEYDNKIYNILKEQGIYG